MSSDSADSQDPKDLLASTISSLHKSGAYSDFKIVCGPEVFDVHKAIVCPQSDFFRAACRTDTFKEGKTGIVTLSPNVERDLDAMELPPSADEFDWDLDVEGTITIKLMIDYFYHHDYPSTPPAKDFEAVQRTVAKESSFVKHARMYAMGEKYGVPGLKALALRKFKSLEGHSRVTYFELLLTVTIIFMRTPDTDRGLREEIADILYTYKVTEEEVVDLYVKQHPDLVYMLYRKLVQDATKKN
ncbi:hypothetical protein KCU73_g8357, partial [Aureobasidium melanogenum]